VLSIAFAIPLSVLVLANFSRDVPLALWTFQGEFGVNVPAIAASITLTTIPIVLMYAVGRRQLLSGLTAGFSK
jgi:raffinose/stachyose/melibiose transport system permease protein